MKRLQIFILAILFLLSIPPFESYAIDDSVKQNNSIDAVGLVGDGETNNDLAFAALIDNLPANGRINLEQGKKYVITRPIVLKKPININLMGSTIISKNSSSIFKIDSDNIAIENGTLDLNYTTHNGITGNNHSKIFLKGLVIKDLLPSATNLEGGIYLKSCTDISIIQCTFNNILNTSDPGDIDHSPAIKFILCHNCSVKQINIENCGVGVNVYASENVDVSDFNMSNINNNGFYIQNNSQNINIKSGRINGAENGLAFNLTNYTADAFSSTVSCTEVNFNNITNKGISLRNGSGLSVTKCSFYKINCAVGQSSDYSGCSNIIIAENTIANPIGNIPFYFKNDIRMSIFNNIFEGLSSSETIAIKQGKGCKNNIIYGNSIKGKGILLKNSK